MQLARGQPGCLPATGNQKGHRWRAAAAAVQATCPLRTLPSPGLPPGGPMPFRQPNYQPMPAEEWIDIDESYGSEMALRQRLVAEQRELVLASQPQAAEANWELLEMLAAFLPERFPQHFSRRGSRLVNHALGTEVDLADPELDPLEAMAVNVQEDLCLCAEDAQGVLRFVSGAVLFPHRWSLLEKLGMDMHRVHEPVPLYAREIQRPVDGFMSRLQPDKPFTRANWTVSSNPELFQPLVETSKQERNRDSSRSWEQDVPVTAENAGWRLHVRVERETLSRLPRSRAILFTIRTHIHRLEHYGQHPEQAVELARALRNLPDEVRAFKGIAAFQEHAYAYLDRAAAAPACCHA